MLNSRNHYESLLAENVRAKQVEERARAWLKARNITEKELREIGYVRRPRRGAGVSGKQLMDKCDYYQVYKSFTGEKLCVHCCTKDGYDEEERTIDIAESAARSLKVDVNTIALTKEIKENGEIKVLVTVCSLPTGKYCSVPNAD